MTTIERTATLSPCGTYRYTLTRGWDPTLPALAWVMLNPSTADAEVDDPTIRRVIRFSQRDGYGGAVVLNLYALRATNPIALSLHRSPVGPDNLPTLSDYARSPLDIVAAWGAHAPRYAGRMMTSGPLRDRRLLCLGKTKGGHPRHPLYVKGDQPFEVYR